MARIAYGMTKATLPLYTHRNSPKTYTQPQLVACVLLMFHLGLSYRDMEEWLLATDKVCDVLELEDVPDHTTLYRAYKRLRMDKLRQMNQELLEKLETKEEAIAADSTGYSTTQASSHYISRSGRRYTEYVKGFYAVGTKSQLILGWLYGRGPSSDMTYLNGLRRQANRYGCKEKRRNTWVILADGGFDGKQARPGDLIPPRRYHNGITDPERQARADLVSTARLDGLFGQRWKSETVYSVIKRKSGDTIRSRKRSHQRREVAIKGLAYNIHY